MQSISFEFDTSELERALEQHPDSSRRLQKLFSKKNPEA